MRGIGSSFNGRIRATRDFEESDKTISFLRHRGLQDSVELISPGVLRLKSDTENLITDHALSVFYEDVGKLAETKILDLFREELRSVKDGHLVKVYVSFRPNSEKTSLRSIIFYSIGSTSLRFTLFPETTPISEDEIESVLAEYPHLAWVSDPNSPLFESSVVDNLKMHLIFKKVLSLEVPKESLRLFKGYARKLIMEKAKEARSVPIELTSVAKKIQSFLRAHSNLAEPKMEAVKAFRTGEGFEEHQITISVIGAEGFTIACGIRIFQAPREKRAAYAIGIRSGLDTMNWGDLFSSQFLKENLEFDPHSLRYALSVFGYRESTRRFETVYAQVFKLFEGYSITTTEDGNIIASIIHKIPYERAMSVDSYINFTHGTLAGLLEFCVSKKVGVSGRVELRGVGKGTNSAILACWDLSKSELTRKGTPQFRFEEYELHTEVYFSFSTKSKIDYLEYPASFVARLKMNSSL